MKHLILAVLAVVALLAYMAAFTISPIEYAAKFRLGKIVRTDFEPGLHWQWPFVNNVIKFDRRIQSLDAQPQRFITAEKKDVIVDSFVKWRIADVREYYTATGGDERRAQARLGQIIADGLRGQFASRTLTEVVSTEREEIMSTLREQAKIPAASLGIEVIDVRIKRIDLPEEVSASVYSRMRAERNEVANQLRSEGKEQAEIIGASADREVTILLAEADRDGQRIRGQGDARATELYAKAYNRDPEFYAFYRSLQAYRSTFHGSNDVMLLDASSEFFDFFRQQSGKKD